MNVAYCNGSARTTLLEALAWSFESLRVSACKITPLYLSRCVKRKDLEFILLKTLGANLSTRSTTPLDGKLQERILLARTRQCWKGYRAIKIIFGCCCSQPVPCQHAVTHMACFCRAGSILFSDFSTKGSTPNSSAATTAAHFNGCMSTKKLTSWRCFTPILAQMLGTGKRPLLNIVFFFVQPRNRVCRSIWRVWPGVAKLYKLLKTRAGFHFLKGAAKHSRVVPLS